MDHANAARSRLPAVHTSPPDTELGTSRLIIRPYRPDDADMYVRMYQANQAHLREFMPNELLDMKGPEDAKAQFERMARQWQSGELFVFGAWEQGSHAFIGEAYLANADWAVPSIELGYFVVASRTGRGFATELGTGLVSMAFDHLRVERIDLRCASDNLASARVAERIGFHLEGCQRLRYRKRDGRLVDYLWYGLLRSEWK